MADRREQISALMRRVRQRGGLPSSAEVVRETFDRLGYIRGSISSEEVIARFNELLRDVWEETLVTLEQHEERSYKEGIPRELMAAYPADSAAAERVASDEGFGAGVIHLFGRWYPYLRDAFLSVSQSRKTRGGKDFELQIESLLTLAGIPYHKQETRDRTDLILPDLATHTTNRTVSAIVSVKRTLRERWAEVAEELFNLRSPNVFLFTADESVSENHVARICGRYNIYLVVWDSVKTAKFPDRPLVLGYTEWATRRLAVLRQNW